MDLQIVFLLVLAFVWIVFATIQDIKTREIANWLNFSLIVFALGFRFFYSLFSEHGLEFFYQGLVGLGIFFIVGHLLYWGRFFAGGDAKLMISLGVILPFSFEFLTNLKIFVAFFILFFFVGAVYIIIVSLGMSIKNFKAFKKEFTIQIKKRKTIVYPVLFFGFLLMVLGIFLEMLFFLGAVIFILPYVYFYTKAVDEACMVRKVSARDLTEGDWLYKDVKVRGRLISANWDGLTKKEITLLKKNGKNVLIRYGIQFTPVFFISLSILVYIFETGLINSLWNLFRL